MLFLTTKRGGGHLFFFVEKQFKFDNKNLLQTIPQ